MSTGIAGLNMVRSSQPAPEATDAGGFAPTLTDAQGRVFTLQTDPVSGHPQYRHASAGSDGAGGKATLEILIDLAADGSYSRRTTQTLDAADGEHRSEQQLDSFGADGKQTGQVVNSETRGADGARQTERTDSDYAGGALVRRQTDIVQSRTQPGADGVSVAFETKIRGNWSEGGAPITDATVPNVDRTEQQVITSDGAGIHKDTPRVLTFTRHATGTPDALKWDAEGGLVVRFDARKGYLERTMKLPLDPVSGEPDMAKAEVTSTDDQQPLVDKGLMKARIWGGLVSNLAWIGGINFARGGLGKAMLGVSAAAAGAQLTGEVHAVATRRNDGDWSRVASSAYDAVLTGLLVGVYSKRNSGSALTSTQQLGLNALGATGLAANGTELLSGDLGAAGEMRRAGVADAKLGERLGSAAAASVDEREWRLAPRADDPVAELLTT